MAKPNRIWVNLETLRDSINEFSELLEAFDALTIDSSRPSWLGCALRAFAPAQQAVEALEAEVIRAGIRREEG